MSQVKHFGPYFATVAVILGIALFVLAVIYTFQQQQRVDHRLCESTVSNRIAVRSTWNAARIFINQGQTDENRERTNAFFDAVLLPIPLLKCVDNKPVPQ